MSEILGYDCNGKALRAGDRALIARTFSEHQDFQGRVVTVLRLAPTAHGHQVLIDIPYHGPFPSFFLDWHSIHPAGLVRIDDQERGDWSEIEKVTGWNPEAVPA